MAPWYLRPVSVVIEQRLSVDAAPKDVFAFLHDPDRRQQWDAMADLARLENASAPAVGVRLHLRGRRTAPSWVGEYTELVPPRRSVLRLVEGVGMPFAAFSQTVEVEARDGGSAVALRLEYRARGVGRLLEPIVLRPRLSTAVRKSLASIARHFA
jgi:uncharacterized protein YndB with AHSA1/START domain